MTTISRISPQAFAATDLFAGLPLSVLKTVASAARERRIPAGAPIFNQGDKGIRAHIVIKGSVRISQYGTDGTHMVLRFIGPGELFGTVPLFTNRRYPADAIALTETTEASWSEAALLDLITRHPQIAINTIRIVGTRLQDAQERMRELGTQRADQRIARTLLRLARHSGHNTAVGTTIAFPLRRKDVADMAGTTLHTASRVLTGWERAGFLTSHRRHLTIRNLSRLTRIAEESRG